MVRDVSVDIMTGRADWKFSQVAALVERGLIMNAPPTFNRMELALV